MSFEIATGYLEDEQKRTWKTTECLHFYYMIEFLIISSIVRKLFLWAEMHQYFWTPKIYCLDYFCFFSGVVKVSLRMSNKRSSILDIKSFVLEKCVGRLLLYTFLNKKYSLAHSRKRIQQTFFLEIHKCILKNT